jgi:hypothetical protein
MSLQWDTIKCNPPTPKDESDSVLRDTLIQATVLVGMADITPKNWQEFYARIHLLEAINGAWRNVITPDNKLEPCYVTPEEVQRWIGMTTNAAGKSRSTFMKQVERSLERMVKEASTHWPT